MSEAPGAYVHVPFCAHRCTYCSFVALAGREGEADHLATVVDEIRGRRGEEPGPLDTVYFGGGTPSFVDPAGLASIRDALAGAFGIAPRAEVTAEANPDDLDPARLDALTGLGVNRLSIGVQSLVDAELEPLERRHDAASALRALELAASRVPRVSGDLMIGIPGQTRESLARSVESLLATGVGHLSVYLLELEKAPRLVALKAARPELFPDDEQMAERWELVDAMAEGAGLPRYETSNWARPGQESRHNLKYWTGVPTLAFGVSAVSFDGRVRRANSGSIPEYARRVRERGNAFVSEARLDGDEALRESVMLGLRLACGVPTSRYDAARATLPTAERERLSLCEEAGLLERTRERTRLTRRGVLLSNEVFSAFV